MARINVKKTELRLDKHRDYLNSIEKDSNAKNPNIVLILCDDLGYGDISCFGSTAIKTPNIDTMAENGVKFNDFYAASPVCTPSRFSTLTGRYPNRNFIKGVFFPGKKGAKPLFKIIGSMAASHGIRGILPDEITIQEVLQKKGYKTGMFGKWHLGDQSPYLPNEKGFDYFFGSYYSNDMEPYEYFRNDKLAIEAPADQTKLTKILTQEIKEFIIENKEEPFFVYYPSPFPHFPVHASEDFQGKSDAGAYGDCVEEIDWSVGEIIKTLEENKLLENTLVIFTSDNGPWYEGSPGFHRGRKGNNFDGGQAVPMIAQWKGTLAENITINEMSMNIDFFPTFLEITGTEPPKDRVIDGKSILSLLKGDTKKTPHKELFFVGAKKFFGIRDADNFKYFDRAHSENSKYMISKQGPFLFNLNHDTNESYDVSNKFPEKREMLSKRLADMQEFADNNPRGWL